MKRKITIAVAPVGRSDLFENNPLTPQRVAQETVECAGEGASLVHLHVRDEHGEETSELDALSETINRIRKESDIIVQGSTASTEELSLEERCAAVREPRIEEGTLNMGSVNFGEGVLIDSFSELRYWADRMKEESVRPELMIFEAGMVNNVRIMNQEGHLEPPFIFTFVLGVKGALPATADSLYFLKNSIPDDSIWGVVHHHMEDFSLLAAALGMGADFIRVGYEDSPDPAIGESNADLVRRAAAVVRAVGLEVATPEEARAVRGAV